MCQKCHQNNENHHRKTVNIGKILSRTTSSPTLGSYRSVVYTDCPPTRLRAVRIRRESHITPNKPKQTLVTTEPTLESRIRKERESQELDENSKSTLECFSSWCQVLKEWRRCSSYGNPCKELAIHLHWHRRDPMKGPITSPPVHGNLYKWQMENPPTHWVHLAILRVINPKAKLHMDMLVSMNVLKAPTLWRQIRVRRYSSQTPSSKNPSKNQRIKRNKKRNRRYRAVMNHEKRSITRTESQGKGRGITIKVVSLKPRRFSFPLVFSGFLLTAPDFLLVFS